jgi:outer membrane lipoprotein
MKRLPLIIVGLLVSLLFTGCAVMSQQVRDQALPQLPFNELVDHVAQYQGQVVIAGGYIVSVQNLEKQTRIVAVQTPLGIGQQPKSKDLSQGRLILIYNGFLDPEIYTKDRQITVGGPILGSSAQEAHAPYPYLKIEVQDIHLWPLPEPVPVDPFWYDDFWYPYPWGWWHPYWHHHHHHR